MGRLCYFAFCYLLPPRWTFSRLGFWLLGHAGAYVNQVMTVSTSPAANGTSHDEGGVK